MTYHPEREKPLTPEEVQVIHDQIHMEEDRIQNYLNELLGDGLSWLVAMEDHRFYHEMDLFKRNLEDLRTFHRIKAKLEYMVREEVPF